MIYNFKNNLQSQKIFVPLNNAQAVNFTVILDSFSYLYLSNLSGNPLTSTFKRREMDPCLPQLCLQDSSHYHLLPDFFKRTITSTLALFTICSQHKGQNDPFK